MSVLPRPAWPRFPAPWARAWRVIALLVVLAGAFHSLASHFEKSAHRVAERFDSRLAAGQWPSVKDYTAVGTYRIARVNSAICLLLALSAPLWWRDRKNPAIPAPPAVARWFLPATAAIAILGGAIRVPLANGGFWHDEALQNSRIHGYHDRNNRDAGGVPVFRPATWEETWFHYRKPVNHTAFSVPSRLCLDAWRKLTGAPRDAFSEFALRLPSLLATVGSLILLPLLGRRWGWPALGLLAALWLALHPWHLRWSVDARGYAIGMFATVAVLHALTAALQTGRARWWVALCLAKLFLVWSSPPHAILAAALSATAVGVIFSQRRDQAAWPRLARLALANFIAGLLFLQVMGPNLMQVRHSSELNPDRNQEYWSLDATSLRHTASLAAFGMHLRIPARDGDLQAPTFERLFGEHQAAGWWLASAHLAIAALGIAVLWRRNRPGALAVTCGFAALAAHFAVIQATGMYYYPRFITYMLPILALATAAAWLGLGELLRPRLGRTAPLVAAALGLAFFQATAAPSLVHIARLPHIPFRGIAAAIEQERARHDGKILVAAYGLTADVFQEQYDARAEFIRNRAQIEERIREARQSGIPFYLIHGSQAFNRSVLPEGYELIDDPAVFTPIASFHGNEPGRSFFLLRFSGSGASLAP